MIESSTIWAIQIQISFIGVEIAKLHSWGKTFRAKKPLSTKLFEQNYITPKYSERKTQFYFYDFWPVFGNFSIEVDHFYCFEVIEVHFTSKPRK